MRDKLEKNNRSILSMRIRRIFFAFAILLALAATLALPIGITHKLSAAKGGNQQPSSSISTQIE